MIVVAFLLAIPVVILAIGSGISAPRYTGSVSDHFDGKRFLNPLGAKAKSLREAFIWMINRKRNAWNEIRSDTFGERPLTHFNGGIRITFVNHTTFLIQVDGLNILTDPIWSTRASPFSWAGPKRMRPPGIRLEDLPRIHLVLLTHNHYDHLDIPTLRIIHGGHHPRIITPLGVGQFLDQQGIGGSEDIDWWQARKINESVQITSVPAQHFSGRGMFDRDATLWCGYMISSTHGNLYFAGDTGYNEKTFREIGQRFKPVRISIIPIGAYKPEWFMGPIHVSPSGAVSIHQDVASEISIASHFGTFQLADDGDDEPVKDLLSALRKEGIAEDRFVVLKEGEPRVFD